MSLAQFDDRRHAYDERSGDTNPTAIDSSSVHLRSSRSESLIQFQLILKSLVQPLPPLARSPDHLPLSSTTASSSFGYVRISLPR